MAVPEDPGIGQEVRPGIMIRPPPEIDRPPPGRGLDQTTVFDLEGLAVYYGEFRAVRDVTMQIFKNEITAFIGPSGCGKTTVLRCFNRMHDVTPGARVVGQLRYHTAELYAPHVSATEVRRRIGMV